MHVFVTSTLNWYWSTSQKVNSSHVKIDHLALELGLVLGFVSDGHESACTTSTVNATFQRFAGDNLTVR